MRVRTHRRATQRPSDGGDEVKDVGKHAKFKVKGRRSVGGTAAEEEGGGGRSDVERGRVCTHTTIQ